LLSKNYQHVSKADCRMIMSSCIDYWHILYLVSILYDIAMRHSFEEFAYERIKRKCDVADYVRKIQTISAYVLTRTE